MWYRININYAVLFECTCGPSMCTTMSWHGNIKSLRQIQDVGLPPRSEGPHSDNCSDKIENDFVCVSDGNCKDSCL